MIKISIKTESSTQENNQNSPQVNGDSKIESKSSPEESSIRLSYPNLSTTISNDNENVGGGIKKDIETEIKDETEVKQSFIEIENKQKKAVDLENKNLSKESVDSSSLTTIINIDTSNKTKSNIKEIEKETKESKKIEPKTSNLIPNLKERNILDESFSDKSHLNFNNDYDKKIIESLLTLISNKDCKFN